MHLVIRSHYCCDLSFWIARISFCNVSLTTTKIWLKQTVKVAEGRNDLEILLQMWQSKYYQSQIHSFLSYSQSWQVIFYIGNIRARSGAAESSQWIRAQGYTATTYNLILVGNAPIFKGEEVAKPGLVHPFVSSAEMFSHNACGQNETYIHRI